MTKDMQLKKKIDVQSSFLLFSLPLSYTFLCPSLLSCALSLISCMTSLARASRRGFIALAGGVWAMKHSSNSVKGSQPFRTMLSNAFYWICATAYNTRINWKKKRAWQPVKTSFSLNNSVLTMYIHIYACIQLFVAGYVHHTRLEQAEQWSWKIQTILTEKGFLQVLNKNFIFLPRKLNFLFKFGAPAHTWHTLVH